MRHVQTGELRKIRRQVSDPVVQRRSQWAIRAFPHHRMPWFGVCRVRSYSGTFNSSSVEEHAQIKSQGTWKCVGAESGTAFPEVDLSEGEWVDYDEKVRAISPPSSVPGIKLFQKYQGRPPGWSLRCREQVASSIVKEKLHKNFGI